jgi:hypothetical protein
MTPPACSLGYALPFTTLSSYVADETVDKIYVPLHKDRRTFTDYKENFQQKMLSQTLMTTCLAAFYTYMNQT